MIVLFVSTTACAFPMLIIRSPKLNIPPSFLFIVRHFGTGVLIATAFVHLLPTAFISLGDPCLSSFWTVDYPAMPGAIALAAVFLVSLVEMIFSSGGHGHTCGNTEIIQQAVSSAQEQPRNNSMDATRSTSRGRTNNNNGGHADHENTNEKNDTTAIRPDVLHQNSSRRAHDPVVGRTASIGRGLAHMSVNSERYDQLDRSPLGPMARETQQKEVTPYENTEAADDSIPHTLTPDQKRKKALMQCVLLEMGILFHSVFIGMALSVSVGNEFVILLIAITFHRKLRTPGPSIKLKLTRLID